MSASHAEHGHGHEEDHGHGHDAHGHHGPSKGFSLFNAIESFTGVRPLTLNHAPKIAWDTRSAVKNVFKLGILSSFFLF